MSYEFISYETLSSVFNRKLKDSNLSEDLIYCDGFLKFSVDEKEYCFHLALIPKSKILWGLDLRNPYDPDKDWKEDLFYKETKEIPEELKEHKRYIERRVNEEWPIKKCVDCENIEHCIYFK